MLENLKLWEELLWDAEGRNEVKPDEGKKHGVCVCACGVWGGAEGGGGRCGRDSDLGFREKEEQELSFI